MYRIIREMNEGKAMGRNRILNKVWKYGREEMKN